MKIRQKTLTCTLIGSARYSLAEISSVLRKHKISHEIRIGEDRKRARFNEMPIRVRLIDTLGRARSSAVNFMVMAPAEIVATGCSIFKDLPIEEAVLDALHQKETTVVSFKKPSAVYYIEAIASPSKLNHIQTEILKIQPYSLRKEAQALMLDFFNSKVSIADAKTAVKRSSKLTRVWVLMKTNFELREAVARLKKETPEEISADTGLSTFDILFISKERKKEKQNG